MKKLFIIFVLFSVILNAQVGINTTDPKATLDIVGDPTDTSVTDGIILPRLTGDELKAKDALYGVDQTGALVYVTAAVNSSTTKTVNVTSEGYFYFNGTVWNGITTKDSAFGILGLSETTTFNTINGNVPVSSATVNHNSGFTIASDEITVNSGFEGLYQITFNAQWNNNTNNNQTNVALILSINGSEVHRTTGWAVEIDSVGSRSGSTHVINYIITLSAGDVIDFQTNGTQAAINDYNVVIKKLQ